MFKATTDGIEIEASPAFLHAQSNPADGRFVWAYTIIIRNLGEETVQLLERYWRITDAAGVTQEVRGAGVIGQQPVLKPGESFTYTSAAPLAQASGLMSGRYTFRRLSDDERFDAEIPAFPLDSPHSGQRAN
jgi:ApaG protein